MIIKNRYAESTKVVVCGCATSITPVVRFPPSGTPAACLAAGPASPLVKRIQVFTVALDTFKYTCNVDDFRNPYQDCLNIMAKMCDPVYLSTNSTRINYCKNSVNSLTLQMNFYWQKVRKECGQWPFNGTIGVATSVACADANIALQRNVSYTAVDGTLIKVTPALTDSVNQALWSNPVLKA